MKTISIAALAAVLAAAGALVVVGSGTEHSQQALREAFANARAKAEILARESGASLGEARRIEESAQAPEPVPLYRAALEKATPIEPGTQQAQATVTVTFSLSA